MFDLGTFSPSTMALNSSRLMLFVLTGIQPSGLVVVWEVVARVAAVLVVVVVAVVGVPEVVTGTVGVLLTAIN